MAKMVKKSFDIFWQISLQNRRFLINMGFFSIFDHYIRYRDVQFAILIKRINYTFAQCNCRRICQFWGIRKTSFQLFFTHTQWFKSGDTISSHNYSNFTFVPQFFQDCISSQSRPGERLWSHRDLILNLGV